MKVIQVIPTLELAGAERMCEALTLELKKRNIDVQVVCLFYSDTPISRRLIQEGIKVTFLNKRAGIDLSIIRKLKKIFAQECPDVVHSHLNAQKYVALAARHMSMTLFVHTVHNVAHKELTKMEMFLAKHLYKRDQVIPVALSNAIQESIADVYGIPLDSIPIIFNGIDLSKCMPKTTYMIEEKVRVLHIGRFADQKNHKGLVDAFKIFHSNRPNSVLNLIGDGENFDEIIKYVEDNQLKDFVLFLGKKADVYKYINEADIFILPSIYEGVPITLIEAMGTGVPIIATNVGGIPDMLENNRDAILTSVSSEELSYSLVALSDDFKLRKKIGENALARAKSFSSEEMACKYIEIYRGGTNDRIAKNRT